MLFWTLFIVLLAQSNAETRTLTCTKVELCSTNLCCIFKNVRGTGSTQFVFQSTLHPNYIRQVRFENSLFHELPTAVFSFFTGLVEIDLSHSGIRHIFDYTFNNAGRLLTIYASRNRVSRLPSMAFHGAFSLGLIDLSYNEISFIDELTFYGLKNLHTLNLARNRIEDLDFNLFQTLEALFVLDLSGNRIMTLDDSLFVNNAFLTHLNLARNQISSIRSRTFQSNKNFSRLYFNENLLKSAEFLLNMEIEQLIFLNLSSNPFNSFSLEKLSKGIRLQEIHARNTSLTILNGATINGIPRLRILDISQNNITELTGLKEGENLTLDHLYLDCNSYEALPNASSLLLGVKMLHLLGDGGNCTNFEESELNVEDTSSFYYPASQASLTLENEECALASSQAKLLLIEKVKDSFQVEREVAINDFKAKLESIFGELQTLHESQLNQLSLDHILYNED